MVYSSFTLVESATNALETWIPLYHLVKIAFLLWAMLPQTQGALLVYKTVIEPLLVRYEGQIDRAHHRASSSIDMVESDIAAAAKEALDAKKRELVDDAIGSLIGGGGKNAAAVDAVEGAPGGAEVDLAEAAAEAEHVKSM